MPSATAVAGLPGFGDQGGFADQRARSIRADETLLPAPRPRISITVPRVTTKPASAKAVSRKMTSSGR